MTSSTSTFPFKKPVIGLTGGIGSGKTAVSNELARLGADIVDTDVIAHTLTGPGGAAMPAIAERFGADAVLPDGRMNRDLIRQRVFSDPAALRDLEAILHPLIRDHANTALRNGQGPYAVLVVPLLIEKQGWRDLLSATLVVDCPEPLQVSRVMARSQLSEDQVRAIMAKQASRAGRLAAATHVIHNDGDLQHLQQQTQSLHRLFVAMGQPLSP